MKLIDTYSELAANAASLEATRSIGSEKDLFEYRKLIGKGKVLLPYLAGDSLAFGPSRFLGYRSNNVATHKGSDGDGKLTNPRIAQILTSKFSVRIANDTDPDLEHHFQEFCAKQSITPDRNKRTYWLTPDVSDWMDENPIGTTGEQTLRAMEEEIRNDTTIEVTTREALIKARVGQGQFRTKVLNAYERCAVTGITTRPLLTASHIVPWRECYHDPKQCLDPANALLLSPTWDKLFDNGYITFDDEGEMLISDELTDDERTRLAMPDKVTIALTGKQKHYMRQHRTLYEYE